jgi:hypothetical protein
MTQFTKTGENIPNYHNITKGPKNTPNGRKIYPNDKPFPF